MSTFEVKVYKLEILPHPNADKIELAKVGDYLSVVKKGEFKTGDLGVYIPEQALVPHWILKEIGLDGKLDGSEKNRVKAHKFRGVLSQGIVYPVHQGKRIHKPGLASSDPKDMSCTLAVKEGTDVTEFLGITKWEPVIPQHMKGKAIGANLSITVNYDIENIKKYNEMFKPGEIVAITEKVHGTFIQVGYVGPKNFDPKLYLGSYTVSSKGLGARGILLSQLDETNVYSKIANDRRYDLGVKLPCIRGEYKELIGEEPIYIMGEIYGPGIQKGFGYGLTGGETAFCMFDIAYGTRGNTKYIDFNTLHRISKNYGIPMVPLIYVGPFNKKILETCTNGAELVSGKHMHMREGSVVKPLVERIDDRAGRVILKSISEAYLLRKGEVTEYQ